MQITLNKSGTKLKLTKRERSLLADTKTLLVNIARQQEPGISDCADTAADRIGEVERALDTPVPVNPPY